MRWKIERTEEFEAWWAELSGPEQNQVIAALRIVRKKGPSAGRPHVDSVHGSRYPNMKELRANRSLRVFFAFDPRRVAIMLIGGDKSGQTRRFYRQTVAMADVIYDRHIRKIGKEASTDEKR